MNIQLMEDRVTKFGGEVFPKFGWCCILAGGAGSGKGYNFDRYVPIEGRKFDPDEVKKSVLRGLKVVDTDLGARITYSDSQGEHTIDLDDAGVKPPYNTTNPQFTGLLHTIARPLTKKLKNFIFKGTGATRDRLPNIIFDCTMSEISDYEIIIPTMKSLGYKIALVCVFTNIAVALTQNKERGRAVTIDDEGNLQYGRRVDYKVLLDTHEGFIRSLSQISNSRPDIISQLDDVWAIITSRNEQPEVISIKDGDSLDLKELRQFINSNLEEIIMRQNKYNMATDKDSYNEGKHVIGAYDLYEALAAMRKLDKN